MRRIGDAVSGVRLMKLQFRGVLHVHPVVGYGTAREMAGARAYLDRLAALAPHYGFGFVHHQASKVKPQAGEQAAAYLSSYRPQPGGAMVDGVPVYDGVVVKVVTTESILRATIGW